MDTTTAPSATNPDPPPSSITYSTVWFACIVLTLRLPWLFPPTTEVASDSYNVGFNNRVCVLCVWLAAALLTALQVMRRRRAPSAGLAELLDDATRHPIRVVPPLLPCAFAAIYCLALWLWYLVLPYVSFGDMYEYVNKVDLVLLHRVPGRDFFWSYGPLFLYAPAALVRLSGNLLDSATAYVISLLLFTVLGLWLLWYVCDLLAGTRQYALLMFGAFALASVNLSMGSGFTLIRFVYPYAALLLLHRMASCRCGPKKALWPCWLQLATSGLLVLGLVISPETGVALGTALVAYHALSWRATANSIFPQSLVLALMGAAFYLLLMPGSLDSLKIYGSGAWNFPLYPSFYTVAFLSAILWVAPSLLAHALSVRGRALTCGLAAIILVLVPAALGRCDPGHNFLNGLGVFLIGLAWAQRTPAPRFGWAIGGFAAFYTVGLPLASGAAYRPQVNDAIIAWRAGQRKPDRNWLRPSTDPDAARIDQKLARVLVRYGKIGSPFDHDEQMDIFLKREGLYVPEYFIAQGDAPIGTHAQLDRKIADISRMNALLFPLALEHPTFDAAGYEAHEAAFLSRVFLTPVHYHLLRRPFLGNILAAAYVRQHYAPVMQVGSSLLMVRRDGGKN